MEKKKLQKQAQEEKVQQEIRDKVGASRQQCVWLRIDIEELLKKKYDNKHNELENKLKDAQQKLEDMSLKLENVSKEKQNLIDKNKESRLVELKDLEVILVRIFPFR